MKKFYTTDVGRPLRWLAIAALSLVTLLMAACALANIVFLCIGGHQHPIKWVLWGTALAIVVVLVCGWMLIRLVRDVRADNGKTVMPEWFIQGFGVFWLLFLLLVAFTDLQPWRLVEVMSIAIAMIGIRGLLRASNSAED